MCERVPMLEVAGGRFSIRNSKLARATTLSNVSGANFFLEGNNENYNILISTVI